MSTEMKKTALVFGGSRGIGAGIVSRLVDDGFNVAFTYVSRHEQAKALQLEIERHGGRALAIEADSCDVNAIKSRSAWFSA